MTTFHSSRAGTLTFEGDYATLTFERRISHPVQVVWEALTEPEHLARWYLTKARVEAREGGSIDYLTGPAQVHVTGKILIWEPPRVFEHEWNVEPQKGSPEGREDHRSLGADARRRRHAPPLHAQAPHAPDRDHLCGRHARFPRPTRERTRRRTPCGLGHPDRRSPRELSPVGDLVGSAIIGARAVTKAFGETKAFAGVGLFDESGHVTAGGQETFVRAPGALVSRRRVDPCSAAHLEVWES